MRVTKLLDLPQVIFEPCSGHFSHLENGSLRAATGGRKNAGHEPWLAGGQASEKHDLGSNLLAITVSASFDGYRTILSCQKHIRFSNYSVVWTDCTRGHLRKRCAEFARSKRTSDFQITLRKLDRLHTRTFAKKARQRGQIAHTYYFWGSASRGGGSLTPAAQPHQPGPAAPAAKQANSAAVQQSIRERAEKMTQAFSSSGGLALKARPPACFHPLDLGGTRSKKG